MPCKNSYTVYFTVGRCKLLGLLAYKSYRQDVLNCTLHLLYCDKDRLMTVRNSEEILMRIPVYATDLELPSGLCSYYGDDVFIFLEAPVSIRTIAHEALHAVRAIFGKMSIDLSENTNELYAYAIGNIVGLVNEFLSDYYGHSGYVRGNHNKKNV